MDSGQFDRKRQSNPSIPGSESLIIGRMDEWLGRRRSHAEAAALLAGNEASGLSRLVFCARTVRAMGTLARSTRSSGSRRVAGTTGAGRWVAVEVPASGPAGAIGSIPARVVDPSQSGAVGRASGLLVVVGRGDTWK